MSSSSNSNEKETNNGNLITTGSQSAMRDQDQDFFSRYYQSQYSSMSGTTEYTNDIFLDDELNNYQTARVRN